MRSVENCAYLLCTTYYVLRTTYNVLRTIAVCGGDSSLPKDLYISVLYDFYGDVLTEKQQEAVELYFNEDLSLAEIAEHIGITRQGVRDSLVRAQLQLRELEETLGLAERFQHIEQAVAEIQLCVNEIENINGKVCNSRNITEQADRITSLVREINRQT